MHTTAAADGEDFVLNGSKLWITNGGFADLFIIFARDPETGPSGISAFVSMPGDGFEVGREIPKMGLHTSSTVELAFSDHRVPGDRGPEDLLGTGFQLVVHVNRFEQRSERLARWLRSSLSVRWGRAPRLPNALCNPSSRRAPRGTPTR